jgi:hypothetical protein
VFGAGLSGPGGGGSEEEEEEEVASNAPACNCGTCSNCSLARAREVPRRLMATGNGALGGAGQTRFDAQAREAERATATTRNALAVAAAAAACRAAHPLWSNDEVRLAVLQRGGPELLAFKRDDPRAFDAFTDRKAQPPPK